MAELNVMLDLETVGLRPGYSVIEIGACTFDRKSTFVAKIDPADARKYLLEDSSTIEWWSRQDHKTREMAWSGKLKLLVALNMFSDWLDTLPAALIDVKVWGNGADFDLPILQGAYSAFDKPPPWKPYSGRCYRTLKALLPHVTPPARASVKHSALDDAIWQAEHATLLLQML